MGAIGPWRPFRDLERWIRNFESSFPRSFDGEHFEVDFSVPAIESFVKDGSLVVRADVPGINPNEIEVSLLGDVLTIKGERKEDKEVKKESYIRREVSYGSFERRVGLPKGIDASKIKATTRDGVIEVTVPLQATATEPKKINVETAAPQESNPKETT